MTCDVDSVREQWWRALLSGAPTRGGAGRAHPAGDSLQPHPAHARACRAVETFRVAIDIQPHDSTFVQLGKVYTLMDNYPAAIEVYMEALVR